MRSIITITIGIIIAILFVTIMTYVIATYLFDMGIIPRTINCYSINGNIWSTRISTWGREMPDERSPYLMLNGREIEWMERPGFDTLYAHPYDSSLVLSWEHGPGHSMLICARSNNTGKIVELYYLFYYDEAYKTARKVFTLVKHSDQYSMKIAESLEVDVEERFKIKTIKDLPKWFFQHPIVDYSNIRYGRELRKYSEKEP